MPTWRRDIEIEADLAEEVARVHGYEDVPSRLPTTTMPDWRETPLAARDAIREALVGAGLTEAVTYALVSARHVETFALDRARTAPRAGEARREGTPITVTNPLSQDHSILRQSLVGSLVEVVGGNARHGTGDVAVFEVGKGYGRVGDAAREWWRLGLALAGLVRGAGLEPAAARRGHRRREGRDRAHRPGHRGGRARLRAADRRADPAPGPERDGRGAVRTGDRRATSRSRASSASCTRGSSRRGTSGRGV